MNSWGEGTAMEHMLVKKAKDGDQEAFAQLLQSNYEFVYKYLVKFTLDLNMAEELTQETMIRGIEKFGLYDPAKSKFSTWLISIAQHLYLDTVRKKSRERKYLNEDEWMEGQKLPKEAQDDSRNRILDALAKLSQNMRIPIVMRHYYGYSLKEIAGKMKIPLGTVKSRIHNGLGILRKELE